MKYTHTVFYASIIIATISLALGFVSGGIPIGAVFVTVLGGLWFISSYYSWKWANSLILVGYVAITTMGTWVDVTPIWLLLGFTGALIGWDLAELIAQEKQTDRISNIIRLERSHLIRIAIITILGIGLSGLAISIRFQFTFAWALLLGIILVIALSRTIGFLKNATK